jgi:hypothetical protein
MNRGTWRGVLGAATLLATVISAGAQAMSDGFESYPLGSIQGQGGWAAWTGAPVSYAGTVTNTFAASGAQSLQIVQGNDTVQTFSGVASGLWSLSLQQYVPASAGGTTWVILLNDYATAQDWAGQMTMNITAGTVGLAEEAAASLPLRKDAWVDIRFDIDPVARSFAAYYDNTLLATHVWDGVAELRALDLYADEGAGTAQVGPVYYDNVALVPEPATLSLLVLGVLGFALRRRI